MAQDLAYEFKKTNGKILRCGEIDRDKTFALFEARLKISGRGVIRACNRGSKLEHGRMPYLTVSTNTEVSADAAASFLKEASKAVASGAGKPEQYVMVKVGGGEPLLFAGSDAPAAFVEMKSIGFPTQGVKGLAGALTELVAKHLGVPKNRTFIVFTDVKASMWGLDGETFG